MFNLEESLGQQSGEWSRKGQTGAENCFEGCCYKPDER